MDYWNNNNTKIFNRNPTFFSQSSAQISSSNLLNNSFLFDRFPGLEVIMHQQDASSSNIPSMEVDEIKVNEHEIKIKRRLSANQLESLETSFEEERKLNPDRKMKLAKELGLQPRQVAIWFQNRRARWKSKKLEHLYHALKIEFDVVSKENQKLQQEVQRLKAILKEQATRKQVCSTEVSCEETVESPSAAAPSQNFEGHNMHNMTQVIVGRDPDNDAGHFVFNVYESESYWGILD